MLPSSVGEKYDDELPADFVGYAKTLSNIQE
jgi:hypothetical protein